jgi:hypothetical protein
MEQFDLDNWCEKFKSLPTEPMSDDLSHLMCACLMDQIKQDSMDELFIYKVVKGRADAIGLVLEQSLLNFMACLCQSPGESTMYLSLLRNEGVHMTMMQFAELFPDGYPTQSELGPLWDLQKDRDAPMGNALDVNWWS